MKEGLKNYKNFVRIILAWPLTSILYRNQDILIVGLPKTATTWAKSVLYELVTDEILMSLDEASSKTFEYGKLPNFESYYSRKCTIVKSHKRRNIFHSTKGKIVYLKRDIIDNIISYFVYSKAKGLTNVSLFSFVKENDVVEWFVEFEKSWLNKAHCVIDYKAIINEDFDYLESVLASLFLDKDRTQIVDILDRNSLARNREKQKQSKVLSAKFKQEFEFVGESDFKISERESIDELDIKRLKDLVSEKLLSTTG